MMSCGCDDLGGWRSMLDRRSALLGGAGLALGLVAAPGRAVAQDATPLAEGQVLIAQPPIGPLELGCLSARMSSCMATWCSDAGASWPAIRS